MNLTDDMKRLRADGMPYHAIAKRYGVAKSTIQKAFGAHPDARPKKAAVIAIQSKPSAQKPKAGRTLTEFRQQYDKDYIVPRKIKAALSEIGAGWEYETQFAKLAGVSLADLGTYRDGFADHVVTLRDSRRAWAGTTATAQAMRAML